MYSRIIYEDISGMTVLYPRQLNVEERSQSVCAFSLSQLAELYHGIKVDIVHTATPTICVHLLLFWWQGARDRIWQQEK